MIGGNDGLFEFMRDTVRIQAGNTNRGIDMNTPEPTRLPPGPQPVLLTAKPKGFQENGFMETLETIITNSEAIAESIKIEEG